MEENRIVVIRAERDGYSPNQCDKVTVGELISFLKEYSSDLPVYLSHDGGYTYGTITKNRISETYFSNEDDEGY